MIVSLHDQIRCVIREISIRERVYPKWVEQGKMKQSTMDAEVSGMKAVLNTLKQLDTVKQYTLEQGGRKE